MPRSANHNRGIRLGLLVVFVCVAVGGSGGRREVQPSFPSIAADGNGSVPQTRQRLNPDPSGEAMPVGDLRCWRQTFTDNFSTDVALGDFPGAVASKWSAYPSPWKDTTGFGTYSPGKVVSISDGVLNETIRTVDGQPLVAALVPKLPGSKSFGYRYGRYAVRFRSDPIAGYKMAWLLWPDSNRSPRDGEIDLPERSLDSDIVAGFVHHQGATKSGDQEQFAEPFDGTRWHTAVIEWSPGLVVFILDGREIGRTIERVPNTAMHWVIQTETKLDWTKPPAADAAGNVQIDWVAAWAYDPSVTC